MKKLLLTALAFCGVMSLQAQQVPQTAPDTRLGEKVEEPQVLRPQTSSRADVEALYLYPDAIGAPSVFRSSLFPDSTVKAVYGDGQGGIVLEYIGTHQVGAVFDPTSGFYSPALTDEWEYTVDSVFIPYLYTRWNPDPTIVDTLLVQIYADDDIVRTSFTGSGTITAFPEYSTALDLGLADRTIAVPLTTSDTSMARWDALGVEVGMQVPEGGIVAVTYKFVPGYEYSLGDTLDAGTDGINVTNRLNQFEYQVWVDDFSTVQDSYNNGLFLISGIKYEDPDLSGWHDVFLPGNAYTIPRYPAVYFDITANEPVDTNNTAIGETQSLINGMLYPNPASTMSDVNIDFSVAQTADVKIDLYNMIGQRVKSVTNDRFTAGTHKVNFSVSDLKPGVYFYTMQAGNYSKTYKFTIAE